MIAFKKELLTGKRILVPPARPEVNPLLRMLKREGAEVVEFPAISVAPPKDYEPMDNAIRKLKIFAWIIFSVGAVIVLSFIAINVVEGLLETNNIPLFYKAGIFLLMIGIVILFVSVVREKLFTYKNDKYKEIQR